MLGRSCAVITALSCGLSLLSEVGVCQKPAGSGQIDLIPATEPGFQQKLRSNFSRVSVDPNLNDILPLLLIVENNSAQPILLYNVIWNVTIHGQGNAARTVKYRSLNVEYPSLNHPLFAELPVLRPHEIQLLSPYFRWSSDSWAGSLAQRSHALAPFLGDPLLRRMKDTKVDIAPFLDIALDADLRTHGPDSQALVEEFYEYRQAEYDVTFKAEKLLREGVPVPQLIDTLQNDASAMSFDNTPERQHYAAEKKVQAQRLAALLRRGDMESFHQFSAKITGTPVVLPHR